MSASGVVVLSRLSAGWTGTITLTNNVTGLQAVITPDARTSPAAIWAATTDRLAHLLGAVTTGWVDTGLKLNIAGQVAPTFTLAASGTTQSRLHLTGTYSGVTSVITASAVADLVHALETGVAMPPTAFATGSPTGDGVLGSRARAEAPSGSVALYSHLYLANSLVLEALVDDGGTYDVFVDGRVITRFRAQDVVRTRWGTRATRAKIDLAGNVVSL